MSNTHTSCDCSYSSESHHHRKHHRKHCRSSRGCSSSSDSCDDHCEMKYSHTPIGVWNLIFEYDTIMNSGASTSNNLQRPSQLQLVDGGTFTNNSTPDLKNNPFGALLSTGVGVWKEAGERKFRLEGTHIAYKASDGSPMAYYKIYINMKVNKRGIRAKFRGCAEPKSLDDPTLCTDATSPNMPVITFGGCGYKVLEPDC